MELTRAEASIKALKNKKNATIVDALNVFYDLCQDIKKHEGTLLHKLPVGDENTVVNRLVWGSNQLQKIAKYNEDTIGYEAQVTRIKSLEKDVKDLEDKLAGISDVIDAYEDTKKALTERKNEEIERLKIQKKLEDECYVLEQEIKEFEENKIPELTTYKQDLKAQLELLVAQYESLQKEVEIVEKQVELQIKDLMKINAQLQDLEQKRNAYQTEIQVKQNEIVALQEQIEQLEQSITKLKNTYENLVIECEKYKEAVEAYEQIKIPEVQAQLETVKAELSVHTTKFYELGCSVKVITGEITKIKERVEHLEKEEKELLAQKEALLKQETVHKETIQSYQDCIATTNASIEKYSSDIIMYEAEIEVVKKRCEEASNELQALLQRYKVLDEQRQVADSETIQWTAKVMSIETEYNDKETEKNKQQKLYETLAKQKKELEETIEKLGEQQQTLIQDIRLLDETLRKSSVDELRKEKQDKEEQLENLKQERVELNLAIQTLGDKIIDRENEKRNLTDTVNKKKELFSKREIEINGLRDEKEEWERKLQTLQREIEALELWLKNRDNSEDKKRMDNYKKRIAFLKEAQSEWKTEAQIIQQFANQRIRGIFNQFNDDYEAYHQTLMQIDEILNNYQQAYCVVTRALYLD